MTRFFSEWDYLSISYSVGERVLDVQAVVDYLVGGTTLSRTNRQSCGRVWNSGSSGNVYRFHYPNSSHEVNPLPSLVNFERLVQKKTSITFVWQNNYDVTYVSMFGFIVVVGCPSLTNKPSSSYVSFQRSNKGKLMLPLAGVKVILFEKVNCQS